MKKKGYTIAGIILVILALISLCFLFWPDIQGMMQARVLADSLEKWEQLKDAAPDQEAAVSEKAEFIPNIFPELYYAMKEYNEHIYETNQEAFNGVAAYQQSVLDVTEYGMKAGPIGKITIPKINVEMALYMGASYKNLAKGFAQMGQTSLPIGGENTNCVVSVHRGWNGAAYMMDAQLLEIGDAIYLENYWDTLEYRVFEIKTIIPNQIDEILIQPGRDLLTIVTCTPYGVGTHRLLIFCERYIEGGN